MHHSNCESAKELSVYELNRTIKNFVFMMWLSLLALISFI